MATKDGGARGRARARRGGGPGGRLGPGVDTDNDSGSDNEIVHGTSQVHDLGAQARVADEDWYPLPLAHGRSFEIRVDGITGDVTTGSTAPTVQLLRRQRNHAPPGSGRSDQLRARAQPALRVHEQWSGRVQLVLRPGRERRLRHELYRRRRVSVFARSTRRSRLPRFNNTNGQVTVLVLQNPSRRTIVYSAGAWTAGGVYLGSFGAVIAPYATSVTNLSTVNAGALDNQSGSLVIRNDGPYQGLTGKGVAVEPATGFTFDTAVTPAPQ